MMNTLAYRLYLKLYAEQFIHSNVCGHILDLLFVNDGCKVDLVAVMDVDFTNDHTVLNFSTLLKMSEKTEPFFQL